MEKIVIVNDDMLMDILSRLPQDSIARLVAVSKEWNRVIRSKGFRDTYKDRWVEKGSGVLVGDSPIGDGGPGVTLHSVNQQQLASGAGSASGQDKFWVEEFAVGRSGQFGLPIRGLVCLEWESKVAICNPGAKLLVALPEIQGLVHKRRARTSYLGYDDDGDVFKVLNMPKPVSENEKQEPDRVFTVRRETIRDGSEAWRPIRCKHAHTPITNGICVGGIIYYGAGKDCNGGPESLVMSFSVKSEEFNAIELPEAGLTIGIRHHFVYYQGQPALVTKGEKGIGANGNGNAVIDMWLWNVIETMWEKNSVEIPGWIDVVNEEMFLYFRGSTRTGHLVFSEDFVSKKPFYVVSYDPLTEVLNKVLINGVARTDDEEETHFMTTFLDYAGTTELLF